MSKSLSELKRLALTEPDPRVQAQYAAELVRKAEESARPAIRKGPSLNLGTAYDTVEEAVAFREMQAPDKYDILHNIVEDKFYAVSPNYARQMLQNPQRWEYANTRNVRSKAARPAMRKANPASLPTVITDVKRMAQQEAGTKISDDDAEWIINRVVGRNDATYDKICGMSTARLKRLVQQAQDR